MTFFTRWRIVFSKWEEAQHPRGKTTAASNSGSFSPKAGEKAPSTDKPVATAPSGSASGSAEKPARFRLRKPLTGADPELDKLVAAAEAPAEALADQYAPPPPLEEVLREFPPEQVAEALRLIEESATEIATHGDSLKQNSLADGKTPTPERFAKAWKPILDREMAKFGQFAPEAGKAPELVFLGGRGGSGKSGFNGGQNGLNLYDKTKAYVIDPDAIKEQLPGYDGSRAGFWHEESSELAKILRNRALEAGINVVIDKTLATSKKSEVELFQKKGYEVRAYFMHVPVEVNLKRVFTRWRNDYYDRSTDRGSPRLVPFAEILKSRDNERNFTELTRLSNVKWALYSSDIPRGAHPRLMASGGG